MNQGEDVALRRATFADQIEIAALVIRHQLNPINLNWSRFWVAVDVRNRVIGCGQIRKHRAADELASLAVHPDWQGLGISKRLIHALIDGCDQPVWLMCESHLIAYYENFGFIEVDDVQSMPPYFQTQSRWSRPTLNMMLSLRGRHLAYMRRTDPECTGPHS